MARKDAAGDKGFFPENFVEVIGGPTPPASKRVQPTGRKPKGIDVKEQPETDGEFDESDESEGELEVIATCKAKFDYTGKTESEMSFKQGDEITIFAKNDDGWWYGESNGNRAYFPVNFTDAWTGD